MAIPTPGELKEKRKSSNGLPSPDTIVPSLIKKREEGERYASQLRSAPNVYNPMQVQQDIKQSVQQRLAPPPVQTQSASTDRPTNTGIGRTPFSNQSTQTYNEMRPALPTAQNIATTNQPNRLSDSRTAKDRWVDDRLALDREQSSKTKVGGAINTALEPLSRYIYELTAEAPGVAAFQRGAAQGLNVESFAPPVQGSPMVNVPAQLIGNIAGAAAGMQGAGVRPVADPLTIGRGAAQGAAQRVPGLSGNIAQRAVEGTVAGAVAGAADSAIRGQTDLKDMAINTGLGAATGGLLDGGIAALGQVGRNARNAAQDVVQRQLGTANAIEKAANEFPVNVRMTPKQVGENLAETAQRTQSPSVPGVANERAFNRTARNSDIVGPEVRAGLEASPNRRYEPITNAGTVEAANQRIAQQGIDAVEGRLLNKKRYNADDVAEGIRTIQELQKSRQFERAVTMADRLSSELTTAGQTVQAASIINRLSPEGALMLAQRKVSRINENLLRGQKPAQITANQSQAITETAETLQAAGVSQERAATVTEIMNRVRAGEKISPAEQQEVMDLVRDAKKYLQPMKQPKAPRPAAVPQEMKDSRVRDRVVSFLDEQEQAALDRIKARRGRANSLPLDEWKDYAIVGASKLAKGTIKFADWSEQMVRDLGENIRPYLNDIYEKSKDMQTQSAKKINDQVISRAERIANSYVNKNQANLSQSDIDFVQNLSRRVSELSGQDQRIAAQDLQAILQGFEKVGIGRKLQAGQYISMLLNPLTQIRNVVGNELLYRIERLQRVVATPIDIAASKISGGPRTITFKRGPSVWENYFQPTQDFFGNLGEGIRAGWRGVSPEGLQSKYEINGQAFGFKPNDSRFTKSIKAMPLLLEKSLGAMLQGFDYAAYQRAANQRMSEMAYLDALNKGIKGNDAIRQHMTNAMTNVDEAVANIARDYGKFVTLQNDSTLARKLMGFRRGLNKITTGSQDFGAGSIVLPFAKTPANLLLRALDYSPAGVLKALKQTHDVLRNPNTDLTRGDVIESVSRSIFGTGIGALAFWLTDKGAMFGKSDKDSEVRKLMQTSGIKDFQINGSAMMRMVNALLSGEDVDKAAKLQPGDTLWGYEWAQPVSMPAAVGSTIYQGVKDDKGALKTAVDGAFAGANTLLDSSVLSGIREAFQIPQGDDNVLKAVMMNLVKQVPSQFVPSLMRQMNTLSDNKLRETYAEKSDLFGQITNSAKANIPGLAQQMPQRVNTLGEPQTRLNTFLDVFVSPAGRSKYKPSPEAQLVIDLMNETGDTSLAPRAVAKYITGKDKATNENKRVDLTSEQFVELQTIVGQETAEGLKKIDPNWPTERKVTEVIKVLDVAGKKGRNKFKKEFGMKVTN